MATARCGLPPKARRLLRADRDAALRAAPQGEVVWSTKIESALAAGLDRGPQPRALADLLGVGRRDGVELRAVVRRGVDPGVFRDRLVEQRGRRDIGVGIAGQRARRG